MGEIKKNKSSVFILPMLTNIPYKHFEGFVNCYIGSSYSDNKSRRIYLVFKTSILTAVNQEALINNEHYVDELIVDDFTVLTYRPLTIFKEDFDRFKEGEYTKFSNKYKAILKKTYPRIKRIHAIISPSDTDRDELQ